MDCHGFYSPGNVADIPTEQILSSLLSNHDDFLKWGYPQELDGLCHGKSQSKMDDPGVPPISGNLHYHQLLTIIKQLLTIINLHIFPIYGCLPPYIPMKLTIITIINHIITI